MLSAPGREARKTPLLALTLAASLALHAVADGLPGRIREALRLRPRAAALAKSAPSPAHAQRPARHGKSYAGFDQYSLFKPEN